MYHCQCATNQYTVRFFFGWGGGLKLFNPSRKNDFKKNRYNRAFALRRARLEIEEKTPVSILKRRQQSLPVKRPERPASVTKRFSAPKGAMPSNNFVRGNSGRSSVSSDVRKTQKPVKDKKISNHEREMENWKRRQSYDPLKAASEGRKKELLKKQQNDNPMVRSCLGLFELNSNFWEAKF